MKNLLRIMIPLLLLAAVGAGVFTRLRGGTAEAGCAATLSSGSDISRAVSEAAAGATICLAPGEYRAFVVSRARAGVTVQGEDAATVVIQAGSKDAVDILDTSRFTLASVTVRGGDPAGLYAARSSELVLRSVTVDAAAIGVHVEAGSATLSNLTVTRGREFGLLARRGASIRADGLRVLEAGGIGVGAVDDPGALTLDGGEIRHAAGSRGESLVLNGWDRFSLSNVSIHGGNPAGVYVAQAKELRLHNVQIDGANFGVHVDNNAVADLEDVTVSGSTGVGLLAQRGGALTGARVHVLDTNGTGVSAINGAGLLTLRDSEIARVAAAGLFAGVAGCADLPPASLSVPPCFYEDLPGQVSTERVLLERVSLTDTAGPCLVFFAGVHADLRDSTMLRCELTGLFAWGAVVNVSGSHFEDNAEHALEYRAFPDPRGDVTLRASGLVEGTTVHATRPLQGAILGAAGPGPVLGGGVLAQGADLTLRDDEVSENHAIGLSFVNNSTGVVERSRILKNGDLGVCFVPGVSVTLRESVIAGNASDALDGCGGLPNGG